MRPKQFFIYAVFSMVFSCIFGYLFSICIYKITVHQRQLMNIINIIKCHSVKAPGFKIGNPFCLDHRCERPVVQNGRDTIPHSQVARVHVRANTDDQIPVFLLLEEWLLTPVGEFGGQLPLIPAEAYLDSLVAELGGRGVKPPRLLKLKQE